MSFAAVALNPGMFAQTSASSSTVLPTEGSDSRSLQWSAKTLSMVPNVTPNIGPEPALPGRGRGPVPHGPLENTATPDRPAGRHAEFDRNVLNDEGIDARAGRE